jgi:hypothetical protein
MNGERYRAVSGGERGRSMMSESPEAHAEGRVARAIEQQTAKLPSDIFLWAALGCIAVGAALELTGHHNKSRWVGQWPANFLLLGLYNKVVKVSGSDRTDHR